MRRQVIPWALTLAGLLGCGGGGNSNSATVHGGSRLKPIAYDVGGADATFEEWMDTKLGAECVFQIGEDGETRCLPSVTFPYVTVGYPDVTCSTPIGLTNAACTGTPARFANWQVRVDSCRSGFKVFRVGDPVAAPASLFFLD